uniref:NADH-ubiquinone oxidoreductase chain 2 n=1 Tax=Tapeinus singularis TaxID=1524541 RepID=A0A343W8S6_9HEMI|nr:NADH dehydrogenase subunit 2 [Tapeinus singularis]AVZ00766.1 NADH dehydrogenase subunit 2 [Tapeinus singularis]
MLNISMMMFILIMVFGTSLTFSSETWLGMWMGLEMNLIAFIPILHKPNNNPASESCMIYFLIQSLGSILMLMSILSNSLVMVSPNMTSELLSTMLMVSLMIKLGMPPFHFWFPEIMEKMTWFSSFILMTWQKVAPLTIMTHTIPNQTLLPMIITMSVITGAVGGLNQTSIRKIMAFSSMNHMGWMVACMKFNNEMWINYLMIYSAIIFTMVITFHMNSSFFINQLTMNSPEFTDKMLITILFMSLGGLPPFLGFLPKWIVIQSMILSNSYFILTIMIMSVLITLFYYLRMISTSLLINNSISKWSNNSPSNKIVTLTLISMNLSLPMIATFSL